MRKLIAFALLFFCLARGESVYRNAGTAAWPFLRMDVSTRAAALGGTGLLNSEAMAIFSNPALLAHRSASISASHNSWFGDTSQQILASVIPWGRFRTSLALRLLSTEGLEYRESPSSEPTGTFGVTDLSFNAGAGVRLGSRFAMGAGMKYIREKVWLEESSGMAFDIGFLFSPGPGLSFAAAAQNYGPGVTMVGREYRLPRSLRAAAGYTSSFPGGTASISFEAHKPLDNRPIYGIGLEYLPAPWAAVRGGYRFEDPSMGVTTGMGLSRGGWTLDYAYVPGAHTLGDTHRIAVTRAL